MTNDLNTIQIETNPATEVKWRAVVTRDGRWDGAFVFGVTSTGIYCRPSCPSRTAKRENVQFYDGAGTAEGAGFRACKRCHPQDHAADPRVVRVMDACAVMDGADPQAGPPSLAGLAARVGGSPTHLSRLFSRLLGLTPRQYYRALRLGRLRTALTQGVGVTDAQFAVGYGSSSRLYEADAGLLGMSPATYAKGGRGVEISYGLFRCETPVPLGVMLVARTAKGICRVAMGDEADPLEAALHGEFANAVLTRDDGGGAALAERINQVLHGLRPHADLPLDVRATAFQWRVWSALAAIGWGETRTYGEIARAIGQPTAARAVGTACGANPVALVVPCHRALGANRQLTGYRWGLERKRALLECERADALQV